VKRAAAAIIKTEKAIRMELFRNINVCIRRMLRVWSEVRLPASVFCVRVLI
jgi:hypothetical protein